MTHKSWMLPDGIEEILPPRAGQLEALRRRLVDLHQRVGYELVYPPLVEHLDSLLTGTGRRLDLQTFKLVDQLSGRSLGIRADMTPQVARIDASRMVRDGVNRLCYVGTVLRTRPEGLDTSRAPMQIGVELFGHRGSESDVEVVSLMIATLREARVKALHVDLGHVGIFRALSRDAGLSEATETRLFELLQRKSLPEMEGFFGSSSIGEEHAQRFRSLIACAGGAEVLPRARELLRGASEAVMAALAELEALAAVLLRREPDVVWLFDLAELRGYHYHNGVVFSAYSEGVLHEIARGGRYDGVGASFGGDRAATGFSSDLRLLLRHYEASVPTSGVFVDCENVEDAWVEIERLRATGERVVCGLSDRDCAVEHGCDRILQAADSGWLQSDI